jgi:hypothetical protein
VVLVWFQRPHQVSIAVQALGQQLSLLLLLLLDGLGIFR